VVVISTSAVEQVQQIDIFPCPDLVADGRAEHVLCRLLGVVLQRHLACSLASSAQLRSEGASSERLRRGEDGALFK